MRSACTGTRSAQTGDCASAARCESGAPEGEAVELLPNRPRDFGLYATNVWAFRDSIDDDKAQVNYIRVWQR